MKLFTSYKNISIGVSAFQAQGKFKIHSKFKNVINLIDGKLMALSVYEKLMGIKTFETSQMLLKKLKVPGSG